MSTDDLTVAFLPIYPNPYQSQLADALAAHGVRVEMIASMPTSSWLHENARRVPILHLHWLYGIYMSRFRTPLSVAAFWRNLSLAQRLGYRIVWTAHNILPHRTELRPLHRLIRARIMREADAVIVHCRYGESELRRLFARTGPITVIPIGNQIGRYPLSMTADEARLSLGLSPDDYVYLFQGFLAPYKGVDRLIEAFWRVAGDSDRLLIAGASLSRSITRQVADAARADPRILAHLSHIPDDAMQRYLLSADVLVAPYRTVLTSSSALLGLSYGLPVIAPALGCLPELVPAEAGILYEPRRTGALAAALTAIKSRDATAMRAASLATATRLDWDTIGRDTAVVYRRCLEPTR